MQKKKTKLDWPQAALASVAIVALAAVYLLGVEEQRDTIEKLVLGAWAFLSTFLGPLLRRRLEDEGEA